jgi:hypothetical protein
MDSITKKAGQGKSRFEISTRGEEGRAMFTSFAP